MTDPTAREFEEAQRALRGCLVALILSLLMAVTIWIFVVGFVSR